MIKMYSAFTEEVDDFDVAIGQLLEQIDMGELKANSAGLINCHYDFIESGAAAAISERLPFDVIGMTTMSSGTNGDYGMYRLALTVLTSDDVSFTAVRLPGLNEDNYKGLIEDGYKEARAQVTEDPKLIISYVPYLPNLSAAEVVYVFDEVVKGIPIFGSVTIGEDMRYTDCRTIYNGEIDGDAVVMLLISGDVEPKFFVTSIPERNIRENRAVITDSEGCVLKTLNDVPVIDYMADLGIILKQEDATTTPFLLYHDESSEPVAVGIFTVNDDGSAIAGGRVPIGAKVAIGRIDQVGIVDTANTTIDKIEGSDAKNGILLHPCVTRFIMLAPNQNDEHQTVSRRLDEGLPYMLGYSGGEICPVMGDDGKYHNRFHNYTFSACVL
jgi:hypothetical protein